MKTLKITKNTKGIIDEGWRYVFNGDLRTDGDVIIDLDKLLYVKNGGLSSGRSLISNSSIDVYYSIGAGWDIKVLGYIKTGLGISVRNDIETGGGVYSYYSIISKGCIYSKRDIVAEYNIKARGHVRADLDIIAGYGVEAGWGIIAGRNIRTCREGIESFFDIVAGKDIKSGGGIKSNKSVRCGGELSVNTRVFAGIGLWDGITEEDKVISCSKFTGEVSHGILMEG